MFLFTITLNFYSCIIPNYNNEFKIIRVLAQKFDNIRYVAEHRKFDISSTDQNIYRHNSS